MLENKTNAVFVSIAALLLVLSAAMPVVLAGDSETTDVTVEVNGVDPTITITDHTSSIPYDGTQTVDIKIETPSQDQAVKDVHIELEHTEYTDIGDAEDYLDTYQYDSSLWSEGVYKDTIKVSGNFMRYGGWEITATAEAEYGYNNDDATASFDVESHVVITDADNGYGEAKPGENVGDWQVSENDTSQPQISIECNGNWELSFEDFTLEGPGDDISGDNTGGTYNKTTGTPTGADGETYDIQYEVYVPYGQEDGTYSTDSDPASHTLTNTDAS